MIEVTSYDGSRVLRFYDCPLCGAKSKLKYVGNERSKKRKITVMCGSIYCRVQKTDGTLSFDFAWLEDIAQKGWNRRPTDSL